MRERKYSVQYKRYNPIGVTTVDEQQAKQQLGQNWFITSTAYIAVYIQGLYTVYSYNGARVQSTVAMLELAGDQGHRQPSHVNPLTV